MGSEAVHATVTLATGAFCGSVTMTTSGDVRGTGPTALCWSPETTAIFAGAFDRVVVESLLQAVTKATAARAEKANIRARIAVITSAPGVRSPAKSAWRRPGQ